LKHSTLYFLVVLTVLFFANNVSASDAHSENTSIKSGQSAQAIVVELSDEQVRRLLIEELQKAELAKEPSKNGKGWLVAFIENIKKKVTLVQERIEFLKSGKTSNIKPMNGLFAYLDKDRDGDQYV
jgi:hypothetical protein